MHIAVKGLAKHFFVRRRTAACFVVREPYAVWTGWFMCTAEFRAGYIAELLDQLLRKGSPYLYLPSSYALFQSMRQEPLESGALPPC